jgi:hypothetical protein
VSDRYDCGQAEVVKARPPMPILKADHSTTEYEQAHTTLVNSIGYLDDALAVLNNKLETVATERPEKHPSETAIAYPSVSCRLTGRMIDQATTLDSFTRRVRDLTDRVVL